MIAGLERPTAGEIWIKGECVYSKEKNIYVPPGKRKLGIGPLLTANRAKIIEPKKLIKKKKK